MQMRCKTISNGFLLKTNIFLLAGAIIFAAVSSLSGKETLRIIGLVIGGLLTLMAVGPSSFWFVWELIRKGRARSVEDPNTLIPGWMQLCKSMSIEKNIKVKVYSNLRNAYADDTTIKIGQPVLDSLDSIAIKAVFVHELGHIKINYTYKLRHLLVAILVGAILATVVWSVFVRSVDPLGFFTCSALFIIAISVMGIVMRFISWPDEYRADLIAEQYVNREAVISFLTSMAELRKVDVTRDFYKHPSINKRRANLDWPEKTRFRKWYFEL
jgi:Zn-dependent protease with chaperone function